MKPFRPKQQTPKELTDTLLDFLRRKFYMPEEATPDQRKAAAVAFAKDRKRLLSWVVLWPASWLNQRGVTLPADKYRERFFKVFLEAKANAADKIKYRPAWLRMVVQSHFEHHGEEIYDQAKAIRQLVEHIVLRAGNAPTRPEPDPTDDMARARAILATAKRPADSKKPALKPAIKDQLSLL